MLRTVSRCVPATPSLVLAGVAAGLAHPATGSPYRQPISVLLDRGSGLAMAAVVLLALYMARVAADLAVAGRPVRGSLVALGVPALGTIALTAPHSPVHIAAFWALVLLCTGLGVVTAFERRSRLLLWVVAAPLLSLGAIPFVGLGAWQLGALVSLGVGLAYSHQMLAPALDAAVRGGPPLSRTP